MITFMDVFLTKYFKGLSETEMIKTIFVSVLKNVLYLPQSKIILLVNTFGVFAYVFVSFSPLEYKLQEHRDFNLLLDC